MGSILSCGSFSAAQPAIFILNKETQTLGTRLVCGPAGSDSTGFLSTAWQGWDQSVIHKPPYEQVLGLRKRAMIHKHQQFPSPMKGGTNTTLPDVSALCLSVQNYQTNVHGKQRQGKCKTEAIHFQMQINISGEKTPQHYLSNQLSLNPKIKMRLWECWGEIGQGKKEILCWCYLIEKRVPPASLQLKRVCSCFFTNWWSSLLSSV